MQYVDKTLEAYCTKDCSVITGYIKDEDKLIYVDPIIPVKDKLVLAQHLLKHGLIGEIPPKNTNEDIEYSNKFHAKNLVI